MVEHSFNPPAQIAVPEGTPVLTVVLRISETREDESNTDGIIIPVQPRRFIHWGIRDYRAFKFTDIHQDGYTLGFPSMPWRSLSRKWGHDPHESDTALYRVNLKSADKIFVVDEQAFLDARQRIDEQLAQENRKCRDRDISSIFAAIAKTLIPLSEYKQDYINPFYLIGRPLKADEARYYEPTFKTQIFNREAARKAASDKNSYEFMKDFLATDTELKPPIIKRPHPHLRLVYSR